MVDRSRLVAVVLLCWLGVVTSSLGQDAPKPEAGKPEAAGGNGLALEPVDFATAATTQQASAPAAAPGSADAWNAIVLSADGKWLATAGVIPGDGPQKGEVVLWNLTEGKVVAEYRQPGRIHSVHFSPDGKLLAIGPDGPQAGVNLIDTAKGEVVQTLPGPAAKTTCFAWSADGKRLALGSATDKTVRVWDVTQKKFLKAHEIEIGTLLAVAFGKDYQVLAAGTPLRDRDGLVVIDASAGKPLQVLKGHKESAESAAFSADGMTLVSGGYDATVRVWNLSTGEEVSTLKGHKRGVRSVSLSADAKRIVSANDREFKLWDGEKKESLGDLGEENAGVRMATMTNDGKWIVTTTRDGRLAVWDAEAKSEKTKLDRNPNAIAAANNNEPDENPGDGDGRPPATPPSDTPESEAIQSLAYSPDGKWLAIAREDGRVTIRTAADGKVHRELEAFTDVASCVTFSPDSKLIAAGSFDKTIKLWKVSDGSEYGTLSGHTNWIFSIAFSKDGTLLASASYDKTVRLWNVAQRKEVASLTGHSAGVRAVAFTIDGQHVISGSGDRTAIVWKLSDHQPVVTLKGHEAALRAVACSPDGSIVATAGEDATVRLWKTSDWSSRTTLKGTEGVMFWCLAFSPQGRTLAAGAFDGTMKLYDPEDGRERTTLRGPTDAITAVAFAPDAHEVVAGSIDKTIRRWTAQKPGVASATSPVGGNTATELKPVEAATALNAVTLKVEQPVASLVFSKDGKWLAVGTGAYRIPGSIQLWDTVKQEKKWQSDPLAFGIPGLAISSDGKQIAAGNYADNFLRLFDFTDGKKQKELRGHRSKIAGVVYSPNGKLFATASLDKDVKIWDATTNKEIRTLIGHSDYVVSVVFTSDSKRLLSASFDKTVRLWDVETGKEVRPFKGHTGPIQQAVFSRDESLVASVSADGTARVWDAASGDYRFTLRGHRAKVDSIAFSPNGKLIATGASDRTFRVWDASCGAELLKVSQEGAIRTLQFSPDGKQLATGNEDKTIKLWDVTGLKSGSSQ